MSEGEIQKKPSLGEALSEAESIIAAAEQRASALIASAQSSIEVDRENAYQEGLEKGVEEVAQTAIRIIEEGDAFAEELASQAAKLALSICSSIIGEHVKVEPETARKIAVKALQASTIGAYATIVVNPEDEKVIEESREDLMRIAGDVKLTIETSKMIEVGGCLVKTDCGEVDAQIDSLVAAIAQRIGVVTDGL